jgi:hypothetical protein
MRPLSVAQLLDAWEKGLSEPVCRRLFPVLAAAYLDCPRDELAALSIGERDRRLLMLRASTFGPQLASVAACSQCGEVLEWEIETVDLLMEKPTESPGELSIDVDDYYVRFRLPNTLDLASISNYQDASSARGRLLENCISDTQHKDEQISSVALPVSVTTEIVKRMAEADPQADLEVDLSCPSCGEQWQAKFDIESFFWTELSAWAQRILLEVHSLARAYGWSESDILNLSPWRRQFYLGMAGT